MDILCSPKFYFKPLCSAIGSRFSRLKMSISYFYLNSPQVVFALFDLHIVIVVILVSMDKDKLYR
jgi:hypothetical protein